MGQDKENQSEKNPKIDKEPEISLSKNEFEELNEKAKKSDEYYDKWLRLQAESENMKKRQEKEREEFLKFANEGLIIQLLPIIDNFDRAMTSVIYTKESDAVLEGIKLVQKELHSLFSDYGVDQIKSVGEKFDPHYHEAIAVIETDEYPEDTVAEEIQKGYTLRGRLIRPSIVKVSKKAKKG